LIHNNQRKAGDERETSYCLHGFHVIICGAVLVARVQQRRRREKGRPTRLLGAADSPH
jgi:hypothetical protein